MKYRWIVLVALMLCSPGCAGCQNQWKHTQSDWTGLDRKITVYSADGAVIREWKTRAKVEDNGGSCWFLDTNGKAVTVSGNFVIEEL